MKASKRAQEIFAEEIAELEKLKLSIDDSFDKVVDTIYNCKGKLVILGIGKTGIIGHKIASSLASTGTPAIFINAAEAVHGDLGMIMKNDIAMLISNSGTTNEIINVITPLRNIGCTLIAMTGDIHSKLAQSCDYVLNVHVEKEACPLDLAPTTSTTATILMGDALTICLMERHKFKKEDFATYHPGGALGRKLLGRVRNFMTTDIPKVQLKTPLKEVVQEMTEKHLGMTLVFSDKQNEDNGNCVGIITDGDLRRAINKYDHLQICAEEIMTSSFKRIHADALLSEALELMDKYNITTLAVTPTPNTNNIMGVISIHYIIDFA
jgi:arabinose-5-phosphate isomerase